jgi:dTDP-4-dehydrorhamnose reductase
MTTVIFGSTGQLGQDLMTTFGVGTVGITHQDVDVTDGVAVAQTLHGLRPDCVVNTAAFHRVDDCEVNPRLAFEVNAIGARNVASAAAAVGAVVVFFSTDYVFGEQRRGRGDPYHEPDQPRPVNAYGVSKAAGEWLAMQANPRHLIVRSSGLYGTATSRKGWTFPELMLQKARSEPTIRVVDDQVLSPTFTADLAATVKQLVERGATGVFHVTNGGECSWFEFAQRVFEIAGASVNLEPISTSTMKTRARRPPYSAMASERLAGVGVEPLLPWSDALRRYLTAKGVAPAVHAGGA